MIISLLFNLVKYNQNSKFYHYARPCLFFTPMSESLFIYSGEGERHPVIIITVINIYFAMINPSLWPLHILAILNKSCALARGSSSFSLLGGSFPARALAVSSSSITISDSCSGASRPSSAASLGSRQA